MKHGSDRRTWFSDPCFNCVSSVAGSWNYLPSPARNSEKRLVNRDTSDFLGAFWTVTGVFSTTTGGLTGLVVVVVVVVVDPAGFTDAPAGLPVILVFPDPVVGVTPDPPVTVFPPLPAYSTRLKEE